jgi:uncharacterized membrane protein
MVALDGAGRVTPGTAPEPTKKEQADGARKLGDRIFIPVLVIPVVTFAFAFARIGGDVSRSALVGLGLGGVAAMAVCMAMTGGGVLTTMDQGRRLNDAIGTVGILPQLLASLGAVFAAAKVGDVIAHTIQLIIPGDHLFLLVLATCLGMALFTIVMGNSFAAFPVIAAGVLVPLIIGPMGADPAMVGIITLTAGSSGTLMTPMAANFNIVPSALLNMKNPYGVIRFQLPFAVVIWSAHVLLLWLMIKAFS